MSRIQVLFCTDGIFPHAVGGMQRHSRLLVEALNASGEVDITVVHPHHGVTVFAATPGIKEIALKEVDSSGTYLVNCYHYSRQVAEVIRAMPEAVVYSQGLAAWSDISEFGNRVIINPHGLEPYQGLTVNDKLRGIPFRLIFNYLFNKAARVVSLGGRLTPILERRAGPGKVVVLPNAVNVPNHEARDFDHSPVKFLFVGRFAFNKGINVLIDAAELLMQEGYTQKVEFYLVGKGPLWDHYNNNRRSAVVHYLGFADDDMLNSLYKSCDVFVLPTLFEGMPTVVLEAMAHGMSIIVTDVGATLEMVGADNGSIIEKNDKHSLATAIKSYLELGPEQRKKLSNRSWQKVSERFTWQKVAASHMNLFKELHSELKKNG